MYAVSDDECDRDNECDRMVDEMGRPNDHGDPTTIGRQDHMSDARDMIDDRVEASKRIPTHDR